MSIKYIFKKTDTLPRSVIGNVLRTTGPDTTVYSLPGHTPVNPFTLTAVSRLPVPRKGNAGTTKTTLSLRREITINKGTDQEKIVPMIARIETSVPVGVSQSDFKAMIEGLACPLLLDEMHVNDLFLSGLPIATTDVPENEPMPQPLL